MKRFIERIANECRTTPAEAADEIDRLIHKVVRKLRQGQPARIPGLGAFQPGPETAFESEGKDGNRRAAPRRTSRPNR